MIAHLHDTLGALWVDHREAHKEHCRLGVVQGTDGIILGVTFARTNEEKGHEN